MSHPVKDGENKYDNYVDASIDALITSLTKAGFSDMDIIVRRAGWPTDGTMNATSCYCSIIHDWPSQPPGQQHPYPTSYI